ncbi:MAG: C39 family peptidase [Planctomycetaceae bacterium]
MRRSCGQVAAGLAFLALFAPVSEASTRAEKLASVRIDGVPHVRQKPDFCGEACAEMYLRKLGRNIDQDQVFDHAGLDPLLGRGCYTRELAKALADIGFDIGPVWFRVTAAEANNSLNDQFRQLHADLRAGRASIVCMHYDEQPKTTEHFRLIVGYDAKSDEVLYHEPAVADGAYRRMKRELLLKLWPLKYDEKEWTVVRMPLKPVRLIQPSGDKTSDADFAQHIIQLKQQLPGDAFSVLIERPFVVVGDEPIEDLRRHSEQTIRWAVDHLKKEYFAKDPEDIIDIWLFKDNESYEANAEKLFGDAPSTPYGYYSSRHRALVMNIATGGGTLVHEIVHPFIAANFPDCPSWFNEGLASLYEQCGERDGKIIGHTNWRLNGLQEAIRRDRVPSFKTLTSTTTREFYDEDKGTNYSQARYLCYYLQEKGLLQKYYRTFVKAAKDDPTGYETLMTVLDRRDMEAFQKEWQEYVLKLQR